MAMEHGKSIAIGDAMYVNPIATNAVKTAQIHTWWCEALARIDPAQKDSYPPHTYISVINESSQ